MRGHCHTPQQRCGSGSVGTSLAPQLRRLQAKVTIASFRPRCSTSALSQRRCDKLASCSLNLPRNDPCHPDHRSSTKCSLHAQSRNENLTGTCTGTAHHVTCLTMPSPSHRRKCVPVRGYAPWLGFHHGWGPVERCAPAGKYQVGDATYRSTCPPI